jgi:uncharacterized sporulation protein YeaH/YhbH (DUF444 family)
MNKYKIDISKEELIDCCVKDLVLKWCKKNHPEIIIEFKNKLEELYNETHKEPFYN